MSRYEDADSLSAAALAAGDPTAWFERLYGAAAAGNAEVPWDRPEPSALLAEWAATARLAGAGRRAVVVGCGLGRDAEFVAGRGFATTAFDIAPTAVRGARARHPDSAVDYQIADLLDLPPAWREAFDLVVESNNVQALPRSLRAAATAAVASLVAPGGTLLVLAAAVSEAGEQGPPWPLVRAEVEAFGAGGLRQVSLDRVAVDDGRFATRWRAEFRR